MRNESDHFLSHYLSPELEVCVKLIREAIRSDHIFLLGVKLPRETTLGVYVDAPFHGGGCMKFHLGVVDPEAAHGMDDISAGIEAICKNIAPIVCLYASSEEFSTSAVSDKFLQGYLLYSSNLGTLNGGGQRPEPPVNVSIWYDKAKRFLMAAESSLVKNELRQCAFMLHQAVEQLYTGLLLKKTGLLVTTHNLSRLQGHINFISERSYHNLPENKQTTFSLLLDALYKDGQYSKNYYLGENDYRMLLDCVATIIENYKCDFV